MSIFNISLLKVAVLFLSITLLLSCGKDDTTNPPASTDSGTIAGYIYTGGDLPLANVTVKTGTLTAQSGVDGKFIIEKVPVATGALVYFSKQGYSSSMKIVKVTKGKTTNVTVYLAPVGQAAAISGSGGGTVETNGSKVTIPANAVVDASGSAFTGNVNLSATYFSPDMENFGAYFPGNFRGVRTDNSETDFKSYGFIDVRLTSGDKDLNIGNGKKATLELQIAPNQLDGAPDEIPLWYFDEKTGKWKEEGKAVKSGDKYIGEVGHFTKWNADLPIPPNQKAYVTGKIEYLSGSFPFFIGNAMIFAIDSTEFGESVDQSGRFLVEMFANTPAVCFVIAQQMWFTKPVNFTSPQPGDTLDLGTLQMELDTNKYCKIKGRMVDAGGNPVNGSPIYICPERVVEIQYIKATTPMQDGRFEFLMVPNTYYKYWIISTQLVKVFGPYLVQAAPSGQVKDLGDVILK